MAGKLIFACRCVIGGALFLFLSNWLYRALNLHILPQDAARALDRVSIAAFVIGVMLTLAIGILELAFPKRPIESLDEKRRPTMARSRQSLRIGAAILSIAVLLFVGGLWLEVGFGLHIREVSSWVFAIAIIVGSIFVVNAVSIAAKAKN